MPAITRTEWWCCSKCNTVDEVHIYEDGSTDMPRGGFLSHGRMLDAITTGFKDRESAQGYLEAHPFNDPRIR